MEENMKIRKQLLSAISVMTLLTSSLVFAEDSHFQSGIAAFKKGDFNLACQHFNRAYQSGLRKGSLLYNLGVCHYKTGKYLESKKWFAQVSKIDSLAQVAHYNLGLIAQKEARPETANHHFRLAQKGNNSTITTLATRNLDLNPKGDSHPQTRSSSKGFTLLNLTFGYDDNIVDPAATAASNAGDNYLSLF
ncbi:MAG: hypothetical protein OQK13_02285, partial [Gammaproteobacteria bacterium]|nr:hypothetical protein [Gammaproteobacteria bacterium]